VSEKACEFPITIIKTDAMSLGKDEGRLKFLEFVIQQIQPEISPDGAFEIARLVINDISVIPEGKTIEDMLKKFDDAPPEN
jgi:hypothetical protein